MVRSGFRMWRMWICVDSSSLSLGTKLVDVDMWSRRWSSDAGVALIRESSATTVDGLIIIVFQAS